MKIHLRADEANGVHTKVTFFLNGKNCGQLTMGDEDAVCFHQIIDFGVEHGLKTDEFLSSGRRAKEEPREVIGSIVRAERQRQRKEAIAEVARKEAIEKDIKKDILSLTRDGPSESTIFATDILEALKANRVRHVTINY